MLCWIDGEKSADATLLVADGAVLRGDGCFEALRSYDGTAFAVSDHVQRMLRSAAALDLEPPEPELLEGWIRRAASEGGDGIVRVVLTRGSDVPDVSAPSRCLVIHHPIPEQPASVRLAPLTAPWHPAGRSWSLAGAKTISYAPNMASRREAVKRGFDDALLISDAGTLLEGPTFSVAWVVDGTIETPGLDLIILDSITRRVVLDLARGAGFEVVEGRFPLDRLEQANEVMVMSTVKEVTPAVAVGDLLFDPGPITATLAERLAVRVGQESDEQGGDGR